MDGNVISLINSWQPRNTEDAAIRHNLLINGTCKQIPQTLSKYSSIDWSNGVPSENAPVWVCWLDGPNELPEIVSRCIRSVCDHSGNHPVKFIDFGNISKYVSIPERIAALLNDGRLNPANFCDILRLMLLFEHGGLWVDADIFVSRDIPDACFSKPFVTVKNNISDVPFLESLKYVAKGRYHISVIGGRSGNSLIGFLLDAFLEYLLKNNEFQFYYLIDYLIEIALRRFPDAAAALKDGAVYNGRHRKLGTSLRKGLPQSEYERSIPPDTVFNVLNWKRNCSLVTKECEPSVYSAFLNNPKADPDYLTSLR